MNIEKIDIHQIKCLLRSYDFKFNEIVIMKNDENISIYVGKYKFFINFQDNEISVKAEYMNNISLKRNINLDELAKIATDYQNNVRQLNEIRNHLEHKLKMTV